jgi:hypothetical protein
MSVPTPQTPPTDPSKHNQLLPIGGPGGALTAKQQAQILFRLTNMPEKYISAPVWLFDGIIGVLDLLAKAFPQMEVRCAGRGATGPGSWWPLYQGGVRAPGCCRGADHQDGHSSSWRLGVPLSGRYRLQSQSDGCRMPCA